MLSTSTMGHAYSSLAFACFLAALQIEVATSAAQKPPKATAIQSSFEAAPVRHITREDDPSVRWVARLGTDAGPPVLHHNRVLIGTNRKSIPSAEDNGDCGALMCLDIDTGDAVWMNIHEKLPDRYSDMPNLGIQSKPVVDGHAVFYVNNRAELVRVDLHRDANGEAAARRAPPSGVIRWVVDFKELGVTKRDAGDIGNPICSPVVVGNLVYAITGHGDFTGAAADGPSFVAVDKQSGDVAWQSMDLNQGLMYGQWASPILVKGLGLRDQVVFPGGDGVLYSYDSVSFQLLWKLDCNPIGTTEWNELRRGTRRFFASRPVHVENALYCALTQDHELSGDGASVMRVDLVAAARGNHAKAIGWRYTDRQFAGSFGQISADGRFLYGHSPNGVVGAIELESGNAAWSCRVGEGVSYQGAPVVHNDRLYVATHEEIVIFDVLGEVRCILRLELPWVRNSPAVTSDLLVVPTRSGLFAIELDDLIE